MCTQKVGDFVNKFETVKNILVESNGIAKTAQFVEAGMSTYDVANLCNKGLIVRIKNGYYSLPDKHNIPDEQIIAISLPEGIICMHSALFYYGYSDFTPRSFDIAIPRKSNRKIQTLPIAFNTYYVSDSIYDLGKTTGIFNAIELPIYNRERTICDCFKHRSKLDNEIFNKAIKAYAMDDNKNLANLSEYAKKLRVYKKVMEIMEVLLNA